MMVSERDLEIEYLKEKIRVIHETLDDHLSFRESTILLRKLCAVTEQFYPIKEGDIE
jgi:hypothetical protein